MLEIRNYFDQKLSLSYDIFGREHIFPIDANFPSINCLSGDHTLLTVDDSMLLVVGCVVLSE